MIFFGAVHVLPQISTFPYKENFDLITPPLLPTGWTTTTNKNITGDFVTSTTTVRSSPNALSTTDATKPQSVITPFFSFKGKFVDTLDFYERRTSTHTSGLLVEASIGSDTTFPILIGDTVKFVNATSYVRRSVALPAVLNDKDSVRFRWRIAGNGSGTSGVLRIDDISLTVKKAVDLALTSLSLSSLSPKQGELLTIAAGVRNRALAGNFSGTVQLFDSLTLVSSQDFGRSFAVNESISIVLNYADIKTGRHPLTAKLLLPFDEDTTNNSLSVVLAAGFRPRTILINEFMYAPPSGMPEWIECANNSSDTISLSGWKISDAGATKAVLLPSSRFILPYSYFIVTTDTASLKEQYALSVPLLHASFSALNNTTADAVVLFDPTNSMIDSVMYSPSWGGSGGKSLERIDTAVTSLLQSNWKTSLHAAGATPGAINSVTQKSFDASVTRISFTPRLPIVGNDISVTSIIKNIGKQSLSSLTYQLFVDANKDSVLTSNETVSQQIISMLPAGDSVALQSTIPSLPQGTQRMFAKVSTIQDDDTTNNILLAVLQVGIPPASVIINEIMYAPAGDMPEWIELYNNSTVPISLSQWKISDNGSAKALITNPSASIAPYSYCIVTTDSVLANYFPLSVPIFTASFSALNNTTPDGVIIYDERGAVMDSIFYRQSWGGLNGNSLQRFDFFSSSTDSANWRNASPSPGEENIVGKKDYDLIVDSVTTAKINGGYSIDVFVKNIGRTSTQDYSVRTYYDENNDSTGQQNELFSQFSYDSISSGAVQRIQMDWSITKAGRHRYIVSVVCVQDQNLLNNSKQIMVSNAYAVQSIVINEILYEPHPGKAEFVELFNRGTDTIDAAGWKLMDQPSSSGSRAVIPLSTNPSFILPHGFVVIASDSSIVAQFPSLAGKDIIINSSLSLSNSGEDIVVHDLTGTQIDSVRYSPLWHLKNVSLSGRSLERINPSLQSNDPRNWSSSVNPSSVTPLLSNSIFTASTAVQSSLHLSPNPFSPDNDGFEDFLTITYSLPANSSTIRIRIFDVTGRLIRRLAQSEPSPSSGSIIWNGLDDDGNRVRIGMYIILFEALDNFGGTAKTMKDVAVVARKL
jgi:hypothetical protein